MEAKLFKKYIWKYIWKYIQDILPEMVFVFFSFL